MMNCCALSLLLGLVVLPLAWVFPHGSCNGYTNITEPWRNLAFNVTSFVGFPKDDSHLLDHWWRFTGIGGDRVSRRCLEMNQGGTEYPLHVQFANPTNESLSKTTGMPYLDEIVLCDNMSTAQVSVAYCPGDFYVYKPLTHPQKGAGYVTYHSECKPESCGNLAHCSANGGCVCLPGYQFPLTTLPTADSYGCVDYDECLDHLCGNGDCLNNIGSFVCTCYPGYYVAMEARPACQDIDECFNSTVCGPKSECTNTPGSFICACQSGWAPTQSEEEPREASNVCIDISECVQYLGICGPNSNCTNLIGSYNCTCNSGYKLNDPTEIASVTNPCIDIDECIETPGICGKNTVCTNVPGTFFCSCPDGFYPSTGILWLVGTSFCKSIDAVLDEIVPHVGQTKTLAFLGQMNQELKNYTDTFLPAATVTNSLSATMEVCGVGPRARSISVSSEGDAEAGSVILDISDRLVNTMVRSAHNQTKQSVQTLTVDMSLETVGAENDEANYVALSARGQVLDMNLQTLASNNNGSATVAILTVDGLESLLSHQYFKTVNKTEMNSDVFTVLLPTVNNTNLTEPVNFTIQHKKKVPVNGIVTCVYWEDHRAAGKGGQSSGWSTKGCWISFAHENYTVCSCSHLSTFALIMQIAEPAPANPFLEWLNRVCVIFGLFFFGLAIFTFLLCSWNPKINNTARLHLCINLSMSHLLLLWNKEYIENELACTVMAGLLHFLIIASFVWMLLEALQLHLLVRRLTKVQVIQRDGLPRPLLYLIGYGVPFTIVGVSALVYSDGYGATEAEMCWLSNKRKFNWALTGPVIIILGLNWILFCATLWFLRFTLANMRSGASQSKDTRLILFKIVAQFVILGCTWILGLYQTNLFFQVLFIILNSQQGTFLFIVHCLLNKEVRDEYIKWLTCTCGKYITEQRDAPSVSEDLDKQTDDGKKE